MTPLARVLWHSLDAIPIAVAMGALLASALLWLYPPQTRDLPRPWRWIMPALRAMAVGALVIALVRPVVLRPRTATREGPIVMLADVSASMSIADGGDRTPAEWVALAAGLQALPPGVARPQVAPALRGQLEGIAAAIDQVARARTESDYARLSERGGGVAAARLRDAVEDLRAAIADLADQQPVPELIPRVAAMKASPPRLDEEAMRSLRGEVEAAARTLDAAQGQADEKLYRDDARVRATCDRIASLSRAQLLAAALKGWDANGVLAKLPAGVAVQAFAFAGAVRAIDESLSSGEIDLEGSGAQSDLAGALRAALRLAPIGGRSATTPAPQAILLFTDGRQVGGDGEGLLSDLSAAGVPVFAVRVAAPASPGRDLSIVQVDAPPAARAGQTVLARVELRGVGLRGQSVDVRLDAGNVRQLRRVTLGGEESSGAAAAAPVSAVAEFDVQLPRAGPQRLSASVLALPDEITDRNNEFDTWIKVGAEPAKVMVIAGDTAGRQYASLHAALSPPQWISLREIDDSSQYRALWARSILDQDVIVLIDLPPDVLDEEQWVAIEQAVRERGASVILCAGQALPEEYAEHPDAELFLPYDPLVERPAWRTWPGGETQFRVAPSAEWESAQQREGVSVDREFWRQLAPLSRMLPITRLRAPARAMLVERDGGAAVMTEMAMGLGRVFFISTDQSWRWRGSGPGSAAREREQFWPQLVRLAAGEPFVAVTNTGLKLDVDNVAPEPERPIVVRAQALDSYGLPVEAATQTLQVLRYGSTLLTTGGSTVTLNSRARGSGQFFGTIAGLPAGDYVLRLDPPEDSTGEFPPDPLELSLRVAPRLESELADLSADERFLRRIAEASGGQFLSLDQLETLPSRLEENRRKLEPLVEYALWDSPYLFVFVLACLSAEWALRKKFALA